MRLEAITAVASLVTLVCVIIIILRLRRARREIKARDDRIAAVCHELRGPLQPITLAVARLKREGELSLKQREAIEIIEKNLAAETRLIEDLWEATRGDRPLSVRVEPCDANAIVSEVCGAARARASEKQLAFDVLLDPGGPQVLADPVRLRQVLRNLVDNAIKFTPSGEKIAVRSDRGDAGRVVLSVTDTGVGIPAEARERIFEPYAQLDGGAVAGGLGLGLFLARKLVLLQGGSLTVASGGKGKGSTFTVSLPGAGAPGPGVPAGVVRAGRLRILLAEDHEDSARMIGELLLARGYAVATVGTVASGLAEAARARPDVLISDLELPDGSGIDLMRKLRLSGPLAGIALSGRRTDSDLAASRSAGFEAHLLKPLDFDALVLAIESARGRAAR